MNEKTRRLIRQVIDNNRAVGGTGWQEYTEKEIIEIYGFLPSWAVQSNHHSSKRGI